MAVSTVLRIHALPQPRSGWSFEELTGRLVQIDGAQDSAVLTLAFALLLEAQQCREPAAWIASRSSVFYPPDADDNGIDLAALPVVRVPDVTAAFAAADLLLRSGGFGLLVADLDVPPAVPSTMLARLAGLARRRHTAVVFLTRGKPAVRAEGSLGSLISLHLRAERRHLGPDRFGCGVVAVKDKHRAPAWRHLEECRGAAGLR